MNTLRTLNFFNAHGPGPRPLSNVYAYGIGLSLKPLYIFSIDKDSM